VTIVLPLPHRLLSPNARPHWRAKAAQTSKHRRWAQLAVIALLGPKVMPLWKSATARCTFYFKDKRRRDRSNLAASVKAYEDGITDAGLWVDDCGVTWLPVVIAFDKADPRLEIEVTETLTTKGTRQ
jgi:crossover junction endodeoxyribonuclease RusA